MKMARGVVAAGHSATVAAAEAVLHEGGNAFDAIVAAHFAACIAEPVLCSLAGGGFMLAHTAGGDAQLYDFFVQTPQHKRAPDAVEFYPILADFGTAQQEFHIGLGSLATPGSVRGLFEIHRDLCTIPMTRLVEPAIGLARDGIVLNDFQAYIFSVIQAIYLSTPAARDIFADATDPNHIVAAGQRLQQREQADFLDTLAREGEAIFYRGEVAERIHRMSQEGGGHLSKTDLEQYKVIKRPPLNVSYRNAHLFTSPPPSAGGLLIAFALDLLEQIATPTNAFGSSAHLRLLSSVMALTNQARSSAELDTGPHLDTETLLNPLFLDQYRQHIVKRARSLRGTTHISVIDGAGNLASMTISNGEGCGHIIPGTGVMLNNMLGEQDLNPGGFHQWPCNQRMTSMMAPSMLLFDDGRQVALGSGGSNRIRTALLQVLINLIDYQMPLAEAVQAPRLHLEDQHLSIEYGFESGELMELKQEYPHHTEWPTRNLFFGGVHSVMRGNGDFCGVGDTRRGGVAKVVS